MPSQHYFLSKPFLYVARFFETLTLSDLLEGAETCRCSPLFQSSMPQLIDISTVTEIDLDFAALTRFLATLRRDYSYNYNDVDMLILVGSDHFFAHARQFQILAESLDSLNVRIFTDPPDCLAALGLADATIEEMLDKATPASTIMPSQ